jgi:hypothetical protein
VRGTEYVVTVALCVDFDDLQDTGTLEQDLLCTSKYSSTIQYYSYCLRKVHVWIIIILLDSLCYIDIQILEQKHASEAY